METKDPKDIKAKLLEGTKELDRLSEEEYGASLDEVLKDPNEKLAYDRAARLIGIEMKKPFSQPGLAQAGFSLTGAKREWHLDKESVEKNKNTWQYEMLDAMREQNQEARPLPDLADFLGQERRFFAYFLQAFRDRICNDTQVRKASKEFQDERPRDHITPITDPRTMMSMGAIALASALLAAIPALGIAGASVIAGLVLIIGNSGLVPLQVLILG